MNLYYCPEYTLAKTAFATTRKAVWIADTLNDDPIDGVVICKPEPLDRDALATVHRKPYIDAVMTGKPDRLAQSNAFAWDPGLWTMVCYTNGGVRSAALDAYQNKSFTGSLSSGLHHAKRNSGGSFCTFNGLVIAAVAAHNAGAKSVLILDTDAHCGGGTFSLIKDYDWVTQLDLSTNPCDDYEPTPPHQLCFVNRGQDYLPTLNRMLASVADQHFDLCLYNAGMDCYEYCFIGGMEGVTKETLAQRERTVFNWLRQHKIPTAFVLAGGYISREQFTQEELVALHRLTIREATIAFA